MFPCPPDALGFSSGVVQLPGGSSVHYVERAPMSSPTSAAAPPSPPLVLVHGWPDSWRSWLRVLPLLPLDRRVIALDQLGYGDSSKPMDDQSFSIPSKARELRAFLDELRVGPGIQLVGHSMGSMVAWEFAARQPAFVEALMLIGTSWRIPADVAEQFRAMIGGLQEVTYEFAEGFQYSNFADVKAAGPWFPPTTVYESLRAPLHTWKAGMEGLLNLTEAYAEAALPRITARTLLVRGEADAVCSEAVYRGFLRLLPGAASAGMVTVPGTAHSVQWEESGAVAVAGLIGRQLSDAHAGGAGGTAVGLAREPRPGASTTSAATTAAAAAAAALFA